MTTEQKIEAVLFYKNEPISIGALASLLEISSDEVREALASLTETLRGRGVQVLLLNDVVELRASAEAGELIQKLRKEELSRDLGKAGVETLSIILYKKVVSRSEVDFIRGVNSTFILRNLLIRGLIERVSNPNDQRSYLYRPTLELLAHLGITSLEELPEYERVQQELRAFESEEHV